MMNRLQLLLLPIAYILSCSPIIVAEEAKFAPDFTGYQEIAQPFLKSYCLKCHGEKRQSGEFRVDVHLPNQFLDSTAKGKWSEVINVLNGHEMPPKKEQQPTPKEVAKLVDWITSQMVRAELFQRDTTIVLRRLNRAEYRNTIRDLMGVNVDIDEFPQDSSAGGFRNNGQALTTSPLHLELYYKAARQLLDRALDMSKPPAKIQWRFEVDSGSSDSNRKRFDGQSLILNGGQNPVKNGFKIIHHDNWNKKLNVRTFRLPKAGKYIIRIRAAGRVPGRNEVVQSAKKYLDQRLERQMKQNPKGARWHRKSHEESLNHFRTDRMYNYGPPRFKFIQHIAGQPSVLTEMDVDATLDKPKIYEVKAWFTSAPSGITLQYDYSIPRVLENFWMQTGDDFARPELYVDWMEIEGPIFDQLPPSYEMILGKYTANPDDEESAAKWILNNFMERAYRRPIRKEELESKLNLFNTIRKQTSTFLDALKPTLAGVLISPHFLYLVEPADVKEPRKLTDYELASRLSYFLWSTMPDQQLMQVVADGKLRDPKVLHKQIDRLLADPKAQAFVKNFAGQWLGLDEIGANPPAPDLYPRYDRHLETSIKTESEEFFAEILHHDLSAMNFVKSNFVVINERLARFYDIPDVKGDHFRRVKVPVGIHRGGLVTQTSMLTITSNGTRTSPVKRGTWILTNVLGTDPGLPVANVGDIAPKVPGIDKATVRQRLEIHRELPQCARCHNKIDPLGFGLENFNASGEWREQEGFGYKGRIGRNDPKIDASAQLPDGTKFKGVDELQQILLKKKDLFLRCLAEKLFTYALGRELGLADRKQIEFAVKHMKENQETLRSLIYFIVDSELFQSK